MARVLIVDDALMMRKMIGKIVEDAGHLIVDEAANGEQAIEMYQKYLPDVVTMDITMPGTDGIEALARIIADDANAKVIMVSALGQQHKVMEALDHGAKGYILKPITAEKILAVIKQVIGGEGCPILSAKSVFECGEGRNQESCDRILGKEVGIQDECRATFLPFVVENKDGCCSVVMRGEFACENFTELMTAVQGMLLVNPMEIVFNFMHSNVLNCRVVNSFIDIMATIIIEGKRLQVICYNQDYMSFFRNVPILKKVDFVLVKKV